jgi:hypothetical protein
MNQDQVDSLVRSLAKIAGGILTAHGLTDVATTVTSASVEELITGILMAVIGFYASHKSNATQPVNTTSVEVTPKVITEITTTPTPVVIPAGNAPVPPNNLQAINIQPTVYTAPTI